MGSFGIFLFSDAGSILFGGDSGGESRT